MQTDELYRVSVRVNGIPHEAHVPARRLLSDFLRHDLRLTGTHVGCEHGVCGACTVLVDGTAMRSCLLFAVSVDGQSITTMEGCRSPEGGLGPVQRAFRECHGLQCGFCTPGFVTTITAFLETNPDPTEEQAREAIGGNLCRCTGYHNIVKSVLRAAVLLREPSTVDEPTPPAPTVEADPSAPSTVEAPAAIFVAPEPAEVPAVSWGRRPNVRRPRRPAAPDGERSS